MTIDRTRRNAVVCAILAPLASVPGFTGGPSAAVAGIPVIRVAPSARVAVPEKTMSDFPGLKPLVAAHRDEQVKMVRLWRTIKEGKGDEKTAAEYKAQQERVGKASEKVANFIARDKWSAEDQAEMQRLWAAELEKPVE
jgi:hypothetical protein